MSRIDSKAHTRDCHQWERMQNGPKFLVAATFEKAILTFCQSTRFITPRSAVRSRPPLPIKSTTYSGQQDWPLIDLLKIALAKRKADRVVGELLVIGFHFQPHHSLATDLHNLSKRRSSAFSSGRLRMWRVGEWKQRFCPPKAIPPIISV